MISTSVTCSICGAKISGDSPDHLGYFCSFCAFERRPHFGPEGRPVVSLEKSLQDAVQLIKIKNVPEIHIAETTPSYLDHINGKYPAKFIPLNPDHRGLKAIWSDMALPFQENLAKYFDRNFHQLAPGGLLYLSTPVKRCFWTTAPLPGQINFFTSKNIMFLLEQHGFKLCWRKNRFSPVLRIIVRKQYRT